VCHSRRVKSAREVPERSGYQNRLRSRQRQSFVAEIFSHLDDDLQVKVVGTLRPEEVARAALATIVDITGLFIYFTTVKLMFGITQSSIATEKVDCVVFFRSKILLKKQDFGPSS